jgi:hypothetical protein
MIWQKLPDLGTWRRTIALGAIALVLSWAMLPLGAIAANLPGGNYPIQQAAYDDADGSYQLMLFDTPAGVPPLYSTTDVQMARLTDEELAAGKGSYAEVTGDRTVLHLDPEFRIAYQHTETATEPDPTTGQPQTVIVRRESSFWTPFAGVIAGQAVANLLFAPRYYVPPMYQPGGVMTGVGGYGNTYNQAVSRYQQRHNEPPAAVKNRQTLRTAGTAKTTRSSRTNPQAGRRTGAGFGASNLKSSSKSTKAAPQTAPRRPAFGSGSGMKMRSGFGSGFGGGRRSFGRRR